MRNLTSLATTAAVLACAGLCSAGVTNDRLYHLGEVDSPAAVNGGAGDNPTKDSGGGGFDASKVGLTFYQGGSSAGGPVSDGLAPGSTVAMQFTNVDSRYVAQATLLSVTSNFGMETYVQVSTGVTEAHFFYNGGTGDPIVLPSDGYGLGVSGNFYAAFIGTSIFKTNVHPNFLQPVEIALVNTGSNDFTVYIQDNAVLSFTTPFTAPSSPSEALSLGNFEANFSPPSYAGVLDEARTFTFSPGGFDPSTDLGAAAAAIPEPATFVLTAIGLALPLGLLCRRRRGATNGLTA
jgi:hypothetical protein